MNISELSKTLNAELAKRPWLQTYTGRAWLPDTPHDYSYDVAEICHCLSQLCRFTGHCRFFYSVAQHSVLVCELAMVDERTRDLSGTQINELGLAALTHDFAEAFVGDVASPLIRWLRPGYHFNSEMSCAESLYDALSTLTQRAIDASLGISRHSPVEEIVKSADLLALAIEKRDVMNPSPHADAWPLPVPPPGFRVVYGQQPQEAEARLFDLYTRLSSKT